MARFSIDELDALSNESIHALCNIQDISIELRAGIEQRSEMVSTHVSWVRSMDERTLTSADWNSSIRSNFDLYSELRLNAVPFKRIPTQPVFMIEDVEAMSDELIMTIVDEGGLELEMSDIRRDVMLRAHAAWVDTLSPDLQETYRHGNTSRSNWELYSEIRINGVPPLRPTLAISASM
jgi:hypothetical protein